MPRASAIEPFLRRRPPPEAQRWAEAAVGRGARITAARRLRGGASSAMHAVDVVDARGRTQRLVLRRYARAGWLALEPDLAEREARVLALLDGSGVPAPRLVAVDAEGSTCDVPAVLMTRLPGRVDFVPRDMDSWLRQLAEALPAIHAVDRRARALVQPYRPYYDARSFQPPRWSPNPRLWQRAVEVLSGPAPRTKRCFIHRDYHPGNVLWSRGRLSGVIDWTDASSGPPQVDVAHCRLNLALLHGVAAAGRFLAAYETATGRRSGPQQPYWDLVAALDSGFAHETRVYGGWRDAGVRGLTVARLRSRLEEHVAGALARL